MKPKITIGVCVKDSEKYIAEAILSISSQDFPHELLEVIFVDDGSKDKTFSIIKRHAQQIDMRVKVFRQTWKGLGAARNIVVDNAEGDYILWVDGDMTLSSDYIRRQVEFMEKNPKVGIAKGIYALTPGPNCLATLEIYSRAVSKMVDFNYKNQTRAKSMGTGGCIYRTRAIKQAGGFDIGLTGYGEDFDAEYKIRSAGWVLSTTNAYFRDYERHGLTSQELWTRYLRRGHDSYYFQHKNKDLLRIYSMLPPIAFATGLLHSFKVYKLTGQSTAFLLPLHYTLKNTAWTVGYIKTRMNARTMR
jgi:glycosyltransferase involved in cell wall biosynthesis